MNPYDGPGRSTGGDTGGHDPAEAAAQIRFLEEEVALLRRKLTESPRHARVLEQRLAESASRLAQLSRFTLNFDGPRSNSRLAPVRHDALGEEPVAGPFDAIPKLRVAEHCWLDHDLQPDARHDGTVVRQGRPAGGRGRDGA